VGMVTPPTGLSTLGHPDPPVVEIERDDPAPEVRGSTGGPEASLTRPPTWRRRGAAPYLVAGDALMLTLAVPVLGVEWWLALVGVLVGCVVLASLSLYRPRLHLAVLDDLPWLAVGAISAVAAIVGLLTWQRETVTINQAVLPVAVLTGLLLSGRLFMYGMLRRARKTGRFRHPVLVVGAGHVGVRLAESLQRHPEYGLDLVGFIDDEPRVDPERLPAPLLGQWGSITEVVHRHEVRRIIVSFGSVAESELVEILRYWSRLPCEVYYVPRLFELHNTTRGIDDVRGIPLVRLRRSAFRSSSWHFKRAFDIVISGTSIVFLLPVFALCALAVRLELGPGVLFRQQRVGLDGEYFDILKFRSLRPASDHESDTRWSISQDNRVGPVGRILRSTSLDEIPQLWNVLRGDMSLVGPRPERPHFVTQFSDEVPRYNSRHRVPVGITGWAQVNHLRGDTSIAERALYDNYYIENWSLWLDVKILLRTARQVVGRHGE
jgi:exopolysaccharide biosynthesis polyprenyl glycosylphosphotransferase